MTRIMLMIVWGCYCSKLHISWSCHANGWSPLKCDLSSWMQSNWCPQTEYCYFPEFPLSANGAHTGLWKDCGITSLMLYVSVIYSTVIYYCVRITLEYKLQVWCILNTVHILRSIANINISSLVTNTGSGLSHFPFTS